MAHQSFFALAKVTFILLKQNSPYAGVAELADAPDLGSGAARRGGSTPFTRTIYHLLLVVKTLAICYYK